MTPAMLDWIDITLIVCAIALVAYVIRYEIIHKED